IVLGSFYWGYALTQIASSVVVNLIGPKRFLALLIFRIPVGGNKANIMSATS
ncbi:unnamed protein product, partial [Rotaria sp. Silwood1]